MAYGIAIELFLVNGTADNLVTAELSYFFLKSIKKNFVFARKGSNSKALRPVTKQSF